MRMVLATDLTDDTADAARFALREARDRSAELVVLHVAGSPELDPDAVAAYRYQLREPGRDAKPVVEEIQHETLQRIKAWFHETAGNPDGVQVSYRLAFGDLPEVVDEVVTDVGAELLVVGAAGTHGVGRKLSRILLETTVPVVVVRKGLFAG